MHCSVREAVLADADSVRDVHIDSITGLAGDAYDDDQVAAWAHDRDPASYPIESAETRFLVAERDQRVVGFGWMKPDADEYLTTSVDGEITAVYVHPSVARSGVGSQLYAALEERARREAVDSLGLWASRNAVGFYRSHGYARIRTHTHEFHDGVEGEVVEMRKRLDG